ncbi:hypothetical protein [Grimontia sp. SpTr1]|uniref:hypothetical protein n=1 Tax=Grimontia sp. SpTr1 TaxID=2995319 RepID=UPI00248CF54B|nr:hypothetical protein [Grimontia sp. SpTr1]
MKTEFQRQLEALGFKSTKQEQREKCRKNTGGDHFNKKKKIAGEPNYKRGRRSTTLSLERMSLDDAKSTIKRLYSDSKNWQSREFGTAFRTITGQSVIPSREKAQEIVGLWHQFDSRHYEKKYSIAVLVLTGIWIPPKRKHHQGMSSQIEARCERRDINASYRVHVFKN